MTLFWIKWEKTRSLIFYQPTAPLQYHDLASRVHASKSEVLPGSRRFKGPMTDMDLLASFVDYISVVMFPDSSLAGFSAILLL